MSVSATSAAATSGLSDVDQLDTEGVWWEVAVELRDDSYTLQTDTDDAGMLLWQLLFDHLNGCRGQLRQLLAGGESDRVAQTVCVFEQQHGSDALAAALEQARESCAAFFDIPTAEVSDDDIRMEFADTHPVDVLGDPSLLERLLTAHTREVEQLLLQRNVRLSVAAFRGIPTAATQVAAGLAAAAPHIARHTSA